MIFKYVKWNDFVKSPITFKVCLFTINLKNRGEKTGWKGDLEKCRKKDVLNIPKEFSVLLQKWSDAIYSKNKSKDNFHSAISINSTV